MKRIVVTLMPDGTPYETIEISGGRQDPLAGDPR